MGKLYQVKVQKADSANVPVTAGHLEYDVARQVADGMIEQYAVDIAVIVDEATGEIVYSIEPFASNVIPLRPGIRPQGVEHGPERD